MITIIHGEDQPAARQRLSSLTANLPSLVRYEAKNLSTATLRSDLEPQNLFGETPTLLIFDLISDKFPHKDELLHLVQNCSSQIILFESQTLTATQLKPFSSAKIEVFPVKASIFKFLDSIAGPPHISQKLLESCISEEPVEKIYAAFCSRLSLLYVALASPSSLKIQGFYKQNILSQAQKLGLSKINQLIQNALEIESLVKTGKSPLPLELHFALLFHSIQNKL